MSKKYRTAWFILQPIIILCRKTVSIKDSRVLVRGLENRKDYYILHAHSYQNSNQLCKTHAHTYYTVVAMNIVNMIFLLSGMMFT